MIVFDVQDIWAYWMELEAWGPGHPGPYAHAHKPGCLLQVFGTRF